jgi:hypothetical protein
MYQSTPSVNDRKIKKKEKEKLLKCKKLITNVITSDYQPGILNLPVII